MAEGKEQCAAQLSELQGKHTPSIQTTVFDANQRPAWTLVW